MEILLRPMEKKFYWARRGIATNGIFLVPLTANSVPQKCSVLGGEVKAISSMQ
jgi:hypothetical protein